MKSTSRTRAAAAVLANDAALWRAPAALAAAAVHAVGPALRAAAEAQLVAALTAEPPKGRLQGTLCQFFAAEALLPVATHAAGAWATRAWQASARRRYDAAYLEVEGARPDLWAMARQPATDTQTVRQVRCGLFAERLRWGVDNEVRALSELLRLAVALGCNALLFARVLGRDATAALLVGVALACGFRLARLAEQSRRTEAARDADREVAAHRARAWDNVVLGNVNNAARWHATKGHLDAVQVRRNAAEADQKATDGALEAGLALAPLAAAVYRQLTAPALDHDAAAQKAARATLTLLPVAFRAAREATQLASSFAGGLVPARKSLLERTLRPALAVPGCRLESFIDPDRIVVRAPDGTEASLREAGPRLRAAARDHVPGLFEVRGPNGSGKSMLLLALKAALPADDAELLPADRAGLLFSPHTGSSGEADLHATDELLAGHAPVLLLDETEANLDVSTRAALRTRLLAHTRPVAADGVAHPGRTVVLVSHV